MSGLVLPFIAFPTVCTAWKRIWPASAPKPRSVAIIFPNIPLGGEPVLFHLGANPRSLFAVASVGFGTQGYYS